MILCDTVIDLSRGFCAYFRMVFIYGAGYATMLWCLLLRATQRGLAPSPMGPFLQQHARTDAGAAHEVGMSRSRKKHPITGISTADSDAPGKRLAHKARRAAERSLGRPVDLREVSDVWCWPKDGKKYVRNDQKEARRK